MTKHKLKTLAVLLCSLLIIGACETEDDISIGTQLIEGVNTIYITQSIEGTPVEREILLHGPAQMDTTKNYPVVFAFHGNGGMNDGWLGSMGSMVNTGEFIGVYPQGHLNSWNLGEEASVADDVAFVNLIVTELTDNYANLNLDKMYAVGYSNGSGMVNRLALQTAHFKAIAPCASQLIEGEEPTAATSPVSVYQVCGTDDGLIPFDGGLSPVGHTFLGAFESIELWASTFNCDSIPTMEMIDNDELYTYSNCDSAREMQFRVSVGSGHETSLDTDQLYYKRIWDFFKLQ